LNQSAKELAAELIGTLWLVLGGCGSAAFAANVPTGDGEQTGLGIGYLGVSLAFGLTVVTGAYALGHISGGHFNPAVTAGLIAGGKFPTAKAVGYIIAQVIGAIIGAFIIYVIVKGQNSNGYTLGDGAFDDKAGVFATNGFGDFSPQGYSMMAVLIAEVVLTAIFLIVILGATAKNAAAGMGGLAIGLCLTLIHLVSIPISNTSVNPARSTGQAIVAAIEGASTPVAQLWLFWLAPIVGGILGGLIHKGVLDTDNDVA